MSFNGTATTVKSSAFEPMGGFPPMIPFDEKLDKKIIDTRGISTTNIVSISDVMKKKQKTDSFMKFGSEESEFKKVSSYLTSDVDGFENPDIVLADVLFENPIEYNKISYKSTKSSSLLKNVRSIKNKK